MKIRIKAGDRHIRISIPHWFLTSRLGMRVALGWLAKNRTESEGIAHQAHENRQASTESRSNSTHLTDEADGSNKSKASTTSLTSKESFTLPKLAIPSPQISKELRLALKQIKKQYGDFPLLEITTEEGESVTILL